MNYAKFALQQGLMFEFEHFGRRQESSLHEYGPWNALFQPLSNALAVCSEEELGGIRGAAESFNFHHWNYWVPPHFKARITRLHGDPSLFFNGVIGRALLRLNEEHRSQYIVVQQLPRSKERALGVTIGCHVRRTDKITESRIYEWPQFLDAARFLLEYNGIDIDEESLYLMLATDDGRIVDQSIVRGEDGGMDLHFVWNPYSIDIGDDGADIQLEQRRTSNALRSVVFDAFMLSESDLFLGQDGSKISQLVVELMATRIPDYKQKLLSLDSFSLDILDFPYWLN